METAEILIYMVAAIMVAGLLTLVLRTADTEQQYKDYVKVFRNEEQEIFKIDSNQLATEILKRWEDCRFGIDNITYAVYVQDEAEINRSMLLQQLYKDDACGQVDCKNKSNGFIFHNTITAPKIINIQCFNNSLIIS